LSARTAEDVADQALLAGQRFQRVPVPDLQIVTGQRGQLVPTPGWWDRAGLAQQLGALLVHLQEQQVGDLLDVGAVVDACAAQHVGVVPDFAHERRVVVVHEGSRAPENNRRSKFLI
jgi:hypothetical protein